MADIIKQLNSSEKSTISQILQHYKSSPLNESLLRSRYNFVSTNTITLDPFSKLRPYMKLIKSEFVQELELSKEYWFSPEEFSNAIYGTYDLANILLYINDMATSHEFKRNKVKVIKSSKIPDLIKILKKIQTDMNAERVNGDKMIVDLTIQKL